MRLFTLAVFLILQWNPLQSMEKGPFKISTAPVSKINKVGDFPCVFINIKNTTNIIQYIDINNLIINSAITHPDKSISMQPVRSKSISTVSDGGARYKERIGDHVVGILPDQTIVRIKELPQAKMAGKAILSISVNISFFSDINDYKKNWDEFNFDIELPLLISLAK